jgi:hypothetical protein
MSRSLRWIGISLSVAVFCALLSAQRAGRLIDQAPPQSSADRFASRFPPEIVLDRFIDVAKVAPKYFTVEMENSDVRVLRAKLDGDARIPLHDGRSGLMVALTDVHVRLTTPDNKSLDLQVKTGETRWIDGDTFSEQNLSSGRCEFLFIETLRPKSPVSDTPPV